MKETERVRVESRLLHSFCFFPLKISLKEEKFPTETIWEFNFVAGCLHLS